MIIRKPDAWDALFLAINMREEDKREIEAFSGREPFEVLLDGIVRSSECFVAVVDDDIMAMWGVVHGHGSILTRRIGVAWLLTSNVVEKHRFLFWKECKKALSSMLNRWDVLVNAIDCRHERAIRWAKRLGFNLSKPDRIGVSNLPFCRFYVTRELLNV